MVRDEDLLQTIKDGQDVEALLEALSRAYTMDELVDRLEDAILEAREQFYYIEERY